MSTTTAQPHQHASRFTRFIPILSWLPHYDRAWLNLDVIAGLTLWGLVVPEAMAYAGIAGLPPQAGLYTLVPSLLIYALLGTARHLSVGPTSATSALLASSVAAVYLADVHAQVREFSRRAGLLEFIGEDQAFPTVDLAVRFVETTV